MSKVISFSLWGNDPKYSEGMVRNAELAKELFPDWECWVYVKRNGGFGPVSTFLELDNMDNVKFMPMHMNAGSQGFATDDWRGMFWRFEPASNSDVEVMISRDCDSRLSMREKLAVDAWMESDKGFHIMRDHPWHGSAILGGMWGVKCGVLSDMHQLMSEWDQENRWQTDQDFLNAIIYPRIADNCMVHASFCRMEPHARNFPVPRSGTEFVGQVFDENEETVIEHVQALAQAL